MRILFTLFSFLFFFSTLHAQLEVLPLESNATLQREYAKIHKEKMTTFVKLAGNPDSDTDSRSHDCDNIDGSFTSGETLFITAGDALEICYNIEIYETFEDVSIDLSHGTSELDSNCIKYIAEPSVLLGLTDTLRIKFCNDVATNDCFSFFFPLVIKRANQSFSFPLQTIAPDTVVTICIDDIQLEGPIHETVIQGCGADLIGEVFNGIFRDTCFLYASSRFAEIDSVCFELCDDHCICDTYTYFFNATTQGASVPFMDDFSYAGPYPDKRKWLDDNVFINSTMAYQPPSVGVATFDGLDQGGSPRFGGTGRSDFLTSNYFSLDDSYDDLWLSYWLENKGYGYPSNPGDSMTLEFKNHLGDWVYQKATDGLDMTNDQLPPFEFNKVKVEDTPSDTFLFDGFQFRFVNRGNRNGMQDQWHLDYVVLDDGEPSGNFKDMAFGALPSDILKRYSSMPFWHFRNNEEEELQDTIAYSIVNLFFNEQLVSTSNVLHEERTTGTDLGANFVVTDDLTSIGGGDRLDVLREVPGSSFDELVTALENLPDSTYREVERTYWLRPGGTQTSSFEDILRNDTVRHTTVFDNYFAYDDGTAEASLSLPSPGWAAAVKFHANVADTLRGVRFHFPHYGTPSNATFFNIKVWVGSLESDPVYVKELVKPYFVDVSYDSLQGFTTYRLEDFDNNPTPVAIPAGDFYVGWQSASTTKTRVGLDYNTPGAESYQFANNTVSWVQTIDKGAYMIRPLLGSTVPGVTKSKELKTVQNEIRIYPNPARNLLYFQLAEEGTLEDYDLRILNVSGQLLKQQVLTAQVDISNLAEGMYFVQLRNRESQLTQVKKVIVVH